MADRETDQTYYMRRALEERQRAAVCEDSSAAVIHLKLAAAYDQKATGELVPTHLPAN